MTLEELAALTDQDVVTLDGDILANMIKALAPLAAIADAYDDNNLDDEARKWWGPDHAPTWNTTPLDQIEILQGRGGKRLLTVQQCEDARTALAWLGLQAWEEKW